MQFWVGLSGGWLTWSESKVIRVEEVMEIVRSSEDFYFWEDGVDVIFPVLPAKYN